MFFRDGLQAFQAAYFQLRETCKFLWNLCHQSVKTYTSHSSTHLMSYVFPASHCSESWVPHRQSLQRCSPIRLWGAGSPCSRSLSSFFLHSARAWRRLEAMFKLATLLSQWATS